MSTPNQNSVNLSFPLQSNVPGLLWNRVPDTLEVNLLNLKNISSEKTTKRVILSTAHRNFFPVGFTCCVTTIPKLLLQFTSENGTEWVEEVDKKTRSLSRMVKRHSFIESNQDT